MLNQKFNNNDRNMFLYKDLGEMKDVEIDTKNRLALHSKNDEKCNWCDGFQINFGCFLFSNMACHCHTKHHPFIHPPKSQAHWKTSGSTVAVPPPAECPTMPKCSTPNSF